MPDTYLVPVLCRQLFVFTHSSASRSRSTGRPPTRCSRTISSASSGCTCPYQTASGYTTTVGPCSHWSRQPDLLMRTVAPSPASRESCCSRVCSALVPSRVQEGRGASAGRLLRQTNTWRSNGGKRKTSSVQSISYGSFQTNVGAPGASPLGTGETMTLHSRRPRPPIPPPLSTTRMPTPASSARMGV
jgi:hypothetical protein